MHCTIRMLGVNVDNVRVLTSKTYGKNSPIQTEWPKHEVVEFELALLCIPDSIKTPRWWKYSKEKGTARYLFHLPVCPSG